VEDNEGTRSLTALLAIALTLGACGGSTATHTTASSPQVTQPPGTTAPQKDYSHYYPPGTHPATRAAIHAINGWADQLRAGHVRAASSYFATPVVVQNASPLYVLKSRHDVYEFNAELPCGAHVVRTLAGGMYTVATFVLTERPHAPSRCGATGQLAATAFLLRHGKISEWRRVLVPPPLGPARNLKEALPGAVPAT
jgi:hypothetical protein